MKQILLLLFLFISCYTSAQLSKTIEVKNPGTLFSLIESDINIISELIISGNLNDDDFTVMNNMTKKGVLKNVNIYDCIIGKEEDYTFQFIPFKAFESCTNLEKIILPKELYVISSHAFEDCISLTEIEFPTSLNRIEAAAFDGCTGLKKLTFPPSLSHLYSSTFYGCTNLKEVNFSYDPSLNITLEISQHYFQSCTSLSRITFLSNYKIGYLSFYNCPLEEIVCKSIDPPTIDNESFDDKTKNNCKVYVPVGAYNNYAWTSKNWSEFKNILENNNSISNMEINLNTLRIYGLNKNIVIESENSGQAIIYNLIGQIIQSYHYNIGINYLNINNGVYIVKTENESTKIVIK